MKGMSAHAEAIMEIADNLPESTVGREKGTIPRLGPTNDKTEEVERDAE